MEDPEWERDFRESERPTEVEGEEVLRPREEEEESRGELGRTGD